MADMKWGNRRLRLTGKGGHIMAWYSMLLALMLLASTPLYAAIPNEGLICETPTAELDRFRYLRALSLDITGTIPPLNLYKELETLDDVPEAWIDAMLSSPEFGDRAVRWHKDLIWSNLSLVRFMGTQAFINVNGANYYVSGTRAVRYRGSNTACADVPATYNPDGSIVTDVDGKEGYVYVQPHWLPPGQIVKVCAFDAQEAEVSANGAECGKSEGFADTTCGCGPNLIYCIPRDVESWIQDAFVEDVNRRVRYVIENDLPYTKLFTSRVAFVNGPIVRYWKSLAHFPGGVSNTPVPVQLESLPDLETWQRGEDDWVQIELPEGHAGILTSPAWLLRFQTNRGRASQFYTKFLCAPLKAQGILSTSDAAIQAEPNLQEKAGCNICHAVLEPASAYWGRWTEAGAGFLAPEPYPALHPECYACATTGLACSVDCSKFYLVKAMHPKEEPYLGQLRWYLFQVDDNKKNVEEGPALLALLEFARNRLPDCTARTLGQRLLGREVSQKEDGWIDELVIHFAGHDFNYRQLVKAIVMSPIYRRML
jgi:hypothetical protein